MNEPIKKDILIGFYSICQKMERHHTDKIRESAKFFLTLNTFLVASFTYFQKMELWTLIFPFLVMIFSWLAIGDMKINYLHFLEWWEMAWNSEKLLGFHDVLKNEKLKNEKVQYLMSERYRESKEELQKERRAMEKRFPIGLPSMLRIRTYVFLIFFSMSTVTVLAILYQNLT